MAIDYGDTRTGLAVCDKNQVLATPAGFITESYPPKLAAAILTKVKEYEAEKLVLGLPKNMDGSIGFRAEKCIDFGELLTQVTGLEVAFVDERLTTVSAHRALSADGVSAKKRKQTVDTLSASIILQSYLDGLKNNK